MKNYRVELEDDNFEIFEAKTDKAALTIIFSEYIDKGIRVLWADRIDDNYDTIRTIY